MLWMASLVNLARHTLVFSGVVFLLLDDLSQVGKQIVAMPVPKILVGIVVPVAYRRQATSRVDVHFPVPQIQEQIVDVPVPPITEETDEVAMLIPQERIQQRTLEETECARSAHPRADC